MSNIICPSCADGEVSDSVVINMRPGLLKDEINNSIITKLMYCPNCYGIIINDKKENPQPSRSDLDPREGCEVSEDAGKQGGWEEVEEHSRKAKPYYEQTVEIIDDPFKKPRNNPGGAY